MNNLTSRFCGIERLESRRLLSLGAVDISFSADGAQTYEFEGEQLVYYASSFAAAPGGKFIVAGTTRRRNGDSQILLARINADGKLDRTFATDGFAMTSLTGPVGGLDSVATANKVAVQGDGKIVVAGRLGNDWAVFRFNLDGSLDRSFDQDGIQTFESHPGGAAVDLELLANGKILVGGITTSQDYISTKSADFGLMRLNANGAVDRSFGRNGHVLSDLGYNDRLNQIAVDSAGRIVVGGVSSRADRFDYPSIVLLRYGANGALDKTFGTRGKVMTQLQSRFAGVFLLQTLHNGRVLLSGSSNGDALIMRLNRRGTLDKAFGNGGMVNVDLGSQNDGAIVLRANRKGIVALGTWGENFTYPPQNSKQFLLNFRSDGSTQGMQREITLGMDGAGLLNGGAKLVENNQVLALFSTSRNGEAGELTFGRFAPSGGIDATFGQNGTLTMPVKGPLRGTPVSAVTQSDGKSLVLAILATAGNTRYVLLRMDASGELDSSFGKGGRVDLGPADSLETYAMALDGAGKIVVAVVDGSVGGTLVLRFDADGSFDNTFGDHGRVVLADGPQSVSRVAVLPDGKILVGGSNFGGIGSGPMAVARLNADGSPDKSFGQNGTLTEYFDDANDLHDLLIGADGRLTVVGTASVWHDLAPSDPVRIFVGRYKADGSVDGTFSRVLIEDAQYAYDARLLPDGGVLVLAHGTNQREFKLIRYKADGSAGSTTVRKVSEDIIKMLFEADGRILLLRASSTVRLAADGSPIAGTRPGGAIKLTSNYPGDELSGTVITITAQHKLLVAGRDDDGDLTLWRYRLD